MDTKNYTRTDNPDGTITLTPIRVSKRFVPKMGEKYFTISNDGIVFVCTWDDFTQDKGCLEIGNVYRTKAEATKARDKQLALVRIQNYIADNDLGKEFVEGEVNHSIAYDHEKKVFFSDYWATYEYHPPLGYLKSEGACILVIENCKEDLLIVWGRK